MSVNAIATMNTILKYYNVSQFVPLIDIKEYPDLGGTPDLLETTTLTETKRHTNILGLQSATDLTFTANYTLANYQAVKALEGTQQKFRLELGENGVDGIFEWEGEISVFPVGGGVNAIRDLSFTITESTPIELVGQDSTFTLAYEGGAITAPSDNVSYDNTAKEFEVPFGLTSFTFKDGVTDMKAELNGNVWVIAKAD